MMLLNIIIVGRFEVKGEFEFLKFPPKRRGFRILP